jgi:hypothetical protein
MSELCLRLLASGGRRRGVVPDETTHASLARTRTRELASPETARAWVDAATVAEYLSIDRSWVYEHADELDARKLGTGPRARLRFSLARVDEYLNACSVGRQSASPEPAPQAPLRRRRRQALGTNVALLPIRGRIPAQDAS